MGDRGGRSDGASAVPAHRVRRCRGRRSAAVGSLLHERVEVAGPEQYRMDEFFRQALAARNDPREVVTDPNDTAGFARCCGPFSLPI